MCASHGASTPYYRVLGSVYLCHTIEFFVLFSIWQHKHASYNVYEVFIHQVDATLQCTVCTFLPFILLRDSIIISEKSSPLKRVYMICNTSTIPRYNESSFYEFATGSQITFVFHNVLSTTL